MSGPTVEATDALQRLQAISNIDTSVFVDGDKAIVKERWSKVFVSQYVSNNLYDAIARKRGADFLPTDQVSKLIFVWKLIEL
jgi:hypothetical protein